MYSLKSIAERIIKDLSGGNISKDSPYKMPFVIAHVRDALRADLKLEILERRGGSMDDRAKVSQYIASYVNIAVQFDENELVSFIDLPSNYMGLFANSGVHQISSIEKPHVAMVPINNNAVTRNLQHSTFEKMNFGYYLEGNRVKWERKLTFEGISTVNVKLVVPAPDDWDDNQALPLLTENLDRVMLKVKQALLGTNVPNDRINDGNPNIRVTNG